MRPARTAGASMKRSALRTRRDARNCAQIPRLPETNGVHGRPEPCDNRYDATAIRCGTVWPGAVRDLVRRGADGPLTAARSLTAERMGSALRILLESGANVKRSERCQSAVGTMYAP